MKERPILFSSPMVRALLDGTKTQTRRIVKPQPPEGTAYVIANEDPDGKGALCISDREGSHAGESGAGVDPWRRCPYGQPGDRLWVRETWAPFDGDGPRALYRADADTDGTVPYLCRGAGGFGGGVASAKPARWVPSIHMPRWASRLTLDVTSIRVERLHDITEEDARAEGVESVDWSAFPDSYDTAREAFAALWKSINGTESWDANPWVWVVGFKPVRP